MDASARWINDYLDQPLSPDEQAEILTMAGFPVEGREDVRWESGDEDVRLDVELTSNRGDCLCHLGLAREIAASAGRTLKAPAPANKPTGPAASSIARVTNREHDRCPLYTGRIIKGVKVGSSPQWLADRLRAIGQIPRNNIVDATNFVLFELGQPTHIFDLAKLKGPEIIIRMAKPGERFLPIGEGEKEVALRECDLVIADREDAVAIAGVKGGALSAVTNATTDILIEAATFDPVAVRNTSRELRIDSASSYRFERGVHAGQVNAAAERLVELILDLAGGTSCEGVLSDGAAIAPPRSVTLRPERCRKLLGIDISDPEMIGYLDRLGLEPRSDRGGIRCTIPPHRDFDLQREADLIEEVGRLHGYGPIPIGETISVRVAPLQPRQQARRAVKEALVGMGFIETVTHSMIAERAAEPFFVEGEEAMRVIEARAGAEPVLRPSIVPSLLRVRATNHDRGVHPLQLFESASTFAQTNRGHRESDRLALLVDLDVDPALGLRPLRGAIERLVEIVCGPGVTVSVDPSGRAPWLRDEAAGAIAVAGETIGWCGVLKSEVCARFELDLPVAAAELELSRFFDAYPPERAVEELPAFPAIERDISIVVPEETRWLSIEETIRSLALQLLESIDFVTTYRGKQVGIGRKSVTLRLRFRAPDRTLRHEEVDPQSQQAMAALRERINAEIRS